MRQEYFFFNDTATTEIYTLSLHDALPISRAIFSMTWKQRKGAHHGWPSPHRSRPRGCRHSSVPRSPRGARSEEHTSELQSRQYLVCRLLLEKKKNFPSHSQRIYLKSTHIT